MDNKTLIDKIAADIGSSPEVVEQLMATLSSVVGEAAADLDSVVLPGFGVFEPKKRLERMALHPASGTRLLVPPKIILSFRPATSLKQKIRNGK